MNVQGLGSRRQTCAGLKDAVQSAEGQAGSQRPSVSGTSENVQEGIDSAADAVKEGTRQAQEYAAEPEKVKNCLSLVGTLAQC